MDTPSTDFSIATPRLRLRHYRIGDEAQLLEYYGDEDVCRYLLHGPWTESDARENVEIRSARTDLDTGDLNVVATLDGRIIGNVSAHFVNDTDHTVELGWTFSPAYAGRGYATEAVTALIETVFSLDRVHRAIAQMDAENPASARLAERVGMRREGHFIQDWWNKDAWSDTFLYAILRAEVTE